MDIEGICKDIVHHVVNVHSVLGFGLLAVLEGLPGEAGHKENGQQFFAFFVS